MSAQRCNARDTAYRLLARRSHTRAELRRKLSLKGFTDDEIAAVLNECLCKGYLNDEQTALRWADGLVRTKHWGKMKIAAFLAQKGIEREMIDRIQHTLWQEYNEAEIARQALRKRFGGAYSRIAPTRIALFLRSRGFSSEALYAVVGKRLREEVE
ncbi:MAG: recombination regulator RecX [Desulfobacterota bacterium]|nr:recombination regulator RecX [Thermodesulfobacteriota bacterium]